MCAGAILNARIPRVVFGARDEKYGACVSVCDLFSMNFNHHPTVETGILADEAVTLMEEFFRQLRVQLRSRPKWKPPTP
jgi:tRNA(adenine34) deaminase